MQRESMSYDVLVVGAGPAGLSAAIRLKQLANAAGKSLSVCLLEKGAAVGAHILSGACFEPRALDELFPDWKDRGAPLNTPVREDSFLFLTQRWGIRLPTPPQMHNPENFIISLGKFCQWLAGEAEALGVEIYSGFSGAEVLYGTGLDGKPVVTGVATGDVGLNRDGSGEGKHGPNYQPGIEILARQTIFAEGCRGSLTQTLLDRFDLRREAQPQTYGLGIKEVWEVAPEQHEPGKAVHTVGWPLSQDVYGGAFLYHLENRQVSVGFVVGLDYANPALSPFEEFQRFKTHPAIRGVFAGGRRIAYGARALSEGGLQSLPRLTFPGGVLVGDGAGFLNVPKIKGSHTAMKSGMLAAEAIFESLSRPGVMASSEVLEVVAYPEKLRESWVWSELQLARNIRPGFRWGLWVGLALAALETYVFRGHAPWTLKHHSDHAALKPQKVSPHIEYPKPDGVLTFDRLSSVFLSNLAHREDQPCHLQIRNTEATIAVNLAVFGAPETRYCPAGVYEIVEQNKQARLQINAQNCLHCKTCDIKDPTQNIQWTTPEGGSGPNYVGM